MAGLGARLELLPPIEEGRTRSIQDLLDGIAHNDYSWTWKVPDDVRVGALDELTAWTRERFGDPATTHPGGTRTVWRAYTLAG
jgi:hypothetical protein